MWSSLAEFFCSRRWGGEFERLQFVTCMYGLSGRVAVMGWCGWFAGGVLYLIIIYIIVGAKRDVFLACSVKQWRGTPVGVNVKCGQKYGL